MTIPKSLYLSSALALAFYYFTGKFVKLCSLTIFPALFIGLGICVLSLFAEKETRIKI